VRRMKRVSGPKRSIHGKQHFGGMPKRIVLEKQHFGGMPKRGYANSRPNWTDYVTCER